jgi:hypothetical protein
MKSFRAQGWLALKKKMILAVGIVGALHAAAVTQAAASASCTAVNSGSFNLTNPAADPGNTSILTDWAVGDRITATFTDAIGFDHSDGFFKGPTVSGIGLLEQATVPHGGSVQVMHNVVAGDLTNGILLDPENFDSVTATCITALVLTSTPSATLHVNQSYSQSNAASGGTASYTYSVSGGAVPAGTSLNTATGLVSGSPTAGGPFSYTIMATDSSPAPALTASQTISGSIIPANSSSTSLTSSVNPSILGAAVTFTATVTGPGGTPTGSVTFYDGATSLGSNALVSGTAALSTSALTVGSHSISALYSGDANYATSTSSTLGQVVGVQSAYVSGTGIDSGACQRDAPCLTFGYALNVTAAGGEINCLDAAGYGIVTVNKSISIVCGYAETGVLAASVNGFIIDAPAGSKVTLAGQDIECAGTGINGIEMIGVGVTLHVHKTQIRNCRGVGGNGILIAPSSGLAKVFVDDSYITNNGAAVANAGIMIRPTGGASANVSVYRVQFDGNTNGVFADGSGGAGPSNVSVSNSALSHSSYNGLAIASSGGAFVATIDKSTISFNAGVGAAVANRSATLRIGSSTIVSNVTGVSNVGGTLQSFGNNIVTGNLSAGTPMTVFPGGPLN